jgi:ATP-dependent exoDNAse (exonuclease V) alpha subunit
MGIKAHFKMTPTPDQERAMKLLDAFLSNDQRVFSLRGYAGTGKTTLMKGIIGYLENRDIPFKLWAPTGRAARVMEKITGKESSTIHSAIYVLDENGIDLESKQKKLTFKLKFNTDHPRTIYFVDESSMIADRSETNTNLLFDDGKLLNHIFHFTGKRKLVFIGDQAQLPPVNCSFSAALSDDYIEKTYHQKAGSCDLTQVVRQKAESIVLYNATRLRNFYMEGAFPPPSLDLRNRPEVKIFKNSWAAIHHYVNELRSNLPDTNAFITYSNGAVHYINNQVRNGLFQKADLPLQKGEPLLVMQNNYKHNLFNGQHVTLIDYQPVMETKGDLQFIKAVVRDPDNNKDYPVRIIQNLLTRKEPCLSKMEEDQIMTDFAMRMKRAGVREKTSRFAEAFQDDEWVNALRVKFGYAMTCHKAQGGEWERVYLNFEPAFDNQKREMQYRWLYTAITRASRDLYVTEHPIVF